jgi:putative ABC transport system permease protein
MRRWLAFISGAWMGVATHKLRSFLTVLGVVIGVAAVIALMSIGRGAEATVISSIESLGSDLIMVYPSARTTGGVRSAGGSAPLTFEDGEAIAEQVPYVKVLAPSLSRSLQVVVGSENMNASVNGVTPEYKEVFNLEMADGTFISDYQYQRGMKVAVLGVNVKNTLFPDSDPIGQNVRMGGIITRVIGVLESREMIAFSTADDSIYVPLTAIQQAVAQPRTSRGERVIGSISLKVSDEDQASYVTDQITELLRTRHQLAPGTDDDFRIMSMKEISTALSEAMGSMTILLGAIAAISLLVGGIGVMNIMLVSVIERTREIGIRKALGAREYHIWGQFLVEAAMLTLTGGIIGIIMGWVISKIVPQFLPIEPLVSPDIVILAVGVSVCIGLFFGFYPAWHASRLNPIEALRAE